MNQVSGKSVSHVIQPEARRLEIHFIDGSILAVELLQDRLAAALTRSPSTVTGNHPTDGPRPTRRQREYLDFIARYIHRFGISPAESDIGRHFLVSAPSVNQMVQTLERRGLITRQRGMPRSISIVDHTKRPVRAGELATPGDLGPNKPLHQTGARLARSGRSARASAFCSQTVCRREFVKSGRVPLGCLAGRYSIMSHGVMMVCGFTW